MKCVVQADLNDLIAVNAFSTARFHVYVFEWKYEQNAKNLCTRHVMCGHLNDQPLNRILEKMTVVGSWEELLDPPARCARMSTLALLYYMYYLW